MANQKINLCKISHSEMLAKISIQTLLKIICLIITITLVPAFCSAQSDLSSESNNINENLNLPDSNFQSGKFISIPEAEKILKGPVYLRDSLSNRRDGYSKFQFTYKSKLPDNSTSQTGTLFFSLEQYRNSADAIRSYALIKAENEKNGKVDNLDQTGDEGFLAMDQLNYPFLMIRKNNRVLKFKLRHLTGKDSLDELQLIAIRIVMNQ